VYEKRQCVPESLVTYELRVPGVGVLYNDPVHAVVTLVGIGFLLFGAFLFLSIVDLVEALNISRSLRGDRP
jgi:hypothetical protein